MKIYNVTIKRVYDFEIEIEAENELEAEEKAQEICDDINIKGYEMYNLEEPEINEVEQNGK